MQVKPGPLDLETGRSAIVSLGRPVLIDLIAEAVAEHPQEKHFGVIASGKSLSKTKRELTLGLKFSVPALACLAKKLIDPCKRNLLRIEKF